ncbi:glycerophosphodiester phosphodiesterase [Trueperella bialowiezensis]|uniref:Glycerophosphoryl diester phosphodiesterase n=1 Tax=Trueperella bialowiezensis TaxID=312285 RepID=A0A448PFN5_9ACTO|nr:glycerophosphodiester phosphodiesterase [Trueperella bialowiezensis]VEI13747.1 Glycerophosphoryl diester phosphodiesterase [Trueperella bialowiezensis]
MLINRLWSVGGEPVVLAHRGGSNEAPENSIEAFRAMHELGFYHIETDCQLTADGRVVVFHDPFLDRVTDASGLISDWTWDDLQHVQDHSGNRIVLLDELLEEFPDFVLNVDAKTGEVAAPMAQVISRHNAVDRVSLASFSERRLRRLRRMLPGVRSSMGTMAIARIVVASKAPRALRRLVVHKLPGPAQGVEAVQVPEFFKEIEVVNERFVALAHSLGLAVHVWTVNEEADMRKLLALGVDGLITDEPSLARAVIAER